MTDPTPDRPSVGEYVVEPWRRPGRTYVGRGMVYDLYRYGRAFLGSFETLPLALQAIPDDHEGPVWMAEAGRDSWRLLPDWKDRR